MLIEAKLNEVSETIVPGTYKARIVSVEEQTSQAGNPMLNWRAVVFDDEKFNNASIFDRTPTTGKGAFRLQEFYKAATGEDLTKENASFDTEQLISSEVMFTLVEGVDRDGNPSKWPGVKAVTAI